MISPCTFLCHLGLPSGSRFNLSEHVLLFGVITLDSIPLQGVCIYTLCHSDYKHSVILSSRINNIANRLSTISDRVCLLGASTLSLIVASWTMRRKKTKKKKRNSKYCLFKLSVINMCVSRGGLYIGPDPTVPPPLVNSNLSNSHGKVADERPRNPKPPSPGRLNYPSDQPLLLLSEKKSGSAHDYQMTKILHSPYTGFAILGFHCTA